MNKSVLFVSLFSFSVIVNAAVEAGNSITPVPIKVAAHSYYVEGLPGAVSPQNQGFMSNAGFVVTNSGVVVFDTLGTPVLAKKLVEAIAKITDQPIRRVIISHYHADHIYGIQVFKSLGAEIWAHQAGQEYLNSEEAQLRLQQRRQMLWPWVDENTRLIPADKWLAGDTNFEMGGLHFELRYVGPAHSMEDMAMYVKEDRVLYSGDLIFKGRVPYVGNADSKLWLMALDKLTAFKPKFLIPGHGGASDTPLDDLKLTSDYLVYVRKVMGQAVKDFVPFDEAYARADWKRFSTLPAFQDANRANAYNTYLLIEKESLSK